MSTRISRRSLLKSAMLMAIAAPLAQACAPKAEPAAPAATAATTSKQEPAEPAAPAKKPLSIATYASTGNDWQRVMARAWQDEHPEVELTIDEVPYGEMNKKQLALLATGNLWDVSFSGIKWYAYSIIKGCFLPLDDLVAAKDPGMDDFIETGIEASKWDNKLYGLPYIIHPGNLALIATNTDMLAEKGIDPPTDETTLEEYLEICARCTDVDAKVFGTNYMPANFYDVAPFRSFGSDVLSEDGKTFLLGVDDKATEAARWVTEIRTKYHAAPLRAESEGLTFQAGQMATRTMGAYWVNGVEQEVGGKFNYNLTLHPVGPAGVAGWQIFTETFSVYSGTKEPDLAYDLVVKETSYEAGVEAVEVSKYNPTGRQSVWNLPYLAEVSDIYSRVVKWMAQVPGPFPMPYNVRFQEAQDTWANNAQDIFYGEMPFDEGIDTLQKRVQGVLDLDRP